MSSVLSSSLPDRAQKIVVAMSGGVDSSCVAAVLQDQGHEVIGMTMQLYDAGIDKPSRKGACCAGQDIYDAKRVAAKIGIPHYVLNYENRFSEAVIQDFADSYAKGETPIPCVKCNQTVKFQDLLKQARELDADCLATGHYVQRLAGNHGWEMHRGADILKDQSYFLYGTSTEQLSELLFPLGGMNKAQTRALATEYGLPNMDKPDSQDICFVGDQGGYASIVQRYRSDAFRAGKIIDIEGKVLGDHQGVVFYTVGQRRGLGLGGLQEPLYVVSVNADTAEVIVGPYEALAVKSVILRDLNWLITKPNRLQCSVQYRSRMSSIKAEIIVDDQVVRIEFAEPQYGVSAGQACVFYNDSQILGGGTMEKTFATWQ